MKNTIIISLVVTYPVVTYLAYLYGRGYRLECDVTLRRTRKLRPGETDPTTLRPNHIHNEYEDLSAGLPDGMVLSRVPHPHGHPIDRYSDDKVSTLSS